MDSSTPQTRIAILVADEGYHNIGDQAMHVNMCRRIFERFPLAQITGYGNVLEESVPVAGTSRVRWGHDYFTGRGLPRNRYFRRGTKGYRVAMLFRYWSVIVTAHCFRMGLGNRLPNGDLKGLVQSLAESDIVLSCGGGYLNSLWWDGMLWRLCACYRAAQVLGKPVVLSGQGIGPISSRLDRLVLRTGLGSADFIALREDGEGTAYLKQMGIPISSFAVTGDDAVDIPRCSEERLHGILRTEGIDRDQRIVVANFRATAYTHRYSGERYKVIASLMDRLVETYGYRVLFVPFCYDEEGGADDRTAAFDVTKHMRHRRAAHIVMGEYSPSEIKSIVSIGEMAVGVSYHFAVFALTQGIPCFTLYDNAYYRLKFTGLYGHFGARAWHALLNQDGIQRTLNAIAGVSEEYEAHRSDLLECTDAMARRVDGVYDKIAELIGYQQRDGRS